LTGFQVTHDSEFTPEDLRAALEWQGEQDLLCTGCGRPRDETMREDDDPDRMLYRAVKRPCRGCEALSIASESAHEDAKGKTLHGLKWALEATPANGR
jgi:hypothetical protein